MTRRTLKLKHETPIWVENRLCARYGYHVSKRGFKEPTILTKWSGLTDPNSKSKEEAPKSSPTSHTTIQSVGPACLQGLDERGYPLTAAEEQILEQRCDNIVDTFLDPYQAVPSVRARLHNMRRTFKYVEEQQFILNYIDENFREGA
jgi:hypothetical protein